MSQMTDQLLRTLERESEIYLEVLDLAHQKKQVIIDGKLKELESITRREQEIVGILIKLENIRSQTVEQLAETVGIRDIQSLTDLIPRLATEDQKEIIRIQKGLQNTFSELNDANQLNGKLLQQSLDIIEFNLNLLDSIDGQAANYGSNASEKDVKRTSNLFDARV